MTNVIFWILAAICIMQFFTIAYLYNRAQSLYRAIDFLFQKLNAIADTTVKIDSNTQRKLSDRYQELIDKLGSIYADCVYYLRMNHFIKGQTKEAKHGTDKK